MLGERITALGQKALGHFAKKRNVTSDKVDWFVPHISSEWFRGQLFDVLCAVGLEIPYDRWFTNLTTTGNTGSAAVYIMLNELVRSGSLRSGQRILCFVPESSRMLFALVHLTVT